jgi:uncharacterized protein YbjT (DUF2867 family)
MRIAVAGGTGLVGSLVVEKARENGDDPVVIARRTGVDLRTGEGLDQALDGVEAVVDVTNIQTTGRKKATEFFEAATRTLLDAERRAGVRHHVLLSIVGVSDAGFGYYTAKHAQEELALASATTTVLRATQFHEFAGQMLMMRGPFVMAPKMLSQPIAAAEVAAELVRLAHEEPAGRVPDIAGPEQQWMPDMVKRLARARGDRRLIVPMGMPGKVGKSMAGGGLLPTGPGPRGVQTFDQWLGTFAH